MTAIAMKTSAGETAPVRGRSSGELYIVDRSGSNGVDIITNTTAKTGSWISITILQDTVFAVLTEGSSTGSLVGLLLPAGLTLFGTFTAITLTSGAVRAYAA